jgi:hypothetical protein
MTDRDNLYFVIGDKAFHNPSYPIGNYMPDSIKKVRRHGILDGYFTQPNVIGLFGIEYRNGSLRPTSGSYKHWANVISHESIHYVLFKYIGHKANHMFDRICPHSFDYGSDGFTRVKRRKKNVSKKKA